MEPFKVSEADMEVFVHPSKAKEVAKAVLHELSTLLFKFNERLDGILLAYEVNKQDSLAQVLNGVEPYLRVDLTAKLLLFTPKPDMLLEGKVVQLSLESIHVVVLGFSSAILIREDIREELKYKVKHSEGRFISRTDKRHVIKVGTTIRFLIKSIQHEDILHFLGSLLPAHTGSVHWLDRPMEEDSKVGRSINKHRQAEKRNDLELDAVSTDGASSLYNVDRQDKRSKRHRTAKDSCII